MTNGNCLHRWFGAAVSSVLLISLVGCHRGDAMSKIKKTKMDMKEFQQDTVVPSALWKAMESVYEPLVMDAEGKAIKEGEKDSAKSKSPDDENLLKKKPPMDPISFKVYLIEKTPGVLGGQNYELDYPIGGGFLDYRNFIPESVEGTFYLKVVYDQEMDKKDSRVYYLSDAKIREVGGSPLGNGCGRYFDISSYWKKQMKGDGLILNTASGRHISVTAGTLFFVSPYRGKLRIAHLTIKDSRHRELSCGDEK